MEGNFKRFFLASKRSIRSSSSSYWHYAPLGPRCRASSPLDAARNGIHLIAQFFSFFEYFNFSFLALRSLTHRISKMLKLVRFGVELFEGKYFREKRRHQIKISIRPLMA